MSVVVALRRALALAVFCILAGVAPSGAGDAPIPGLESDLGSDLVVTGVTMRVQPLSETPSSVTIVTAAEIRAHGYHTLAEALRWVRGLHVSYDRNYSYLGVRGIQRPGDYNNKVLLTLDGHPMNGALFGDASFGEELGLDMETVDRIEVVRGPGSALHGSYAVLAVINVVTRRPESRKGVGATGRLGSFDDRRAWVSAAGARPGRPSWAASASWTGMRGPNLYFPEYDGATPSGGRAIDSDGERAASFHGVMEWGEARLVAKFNDRMKRVPTGAFGVRFNDRDTRTSDGHDFVELSQRVRPSAATELLARAWWDGVRYTGHYMYGPDSAAYDNFDRGDADVIGTEWRLNWSPAERHVVTSGLDLQQAVKTRLQNYDVSPFNIYTDVRSNRSRAGVYVQDEVHLGPRGLATAGVRLDRSHGFDPVLSPRVDLVWNSGPTTTWKVLAGTAFRAPVVYETDYVSPDQVGAPDLKPERIATLETEVERRMGSVTATLSAYRNWVSDLIDVVQIDTAGTLQFQNRGKVEGHGIEGELRYVSAGGTRARFAAVLLDNNLLGPGTDLTNSPHINAHLLVSHAAPGAPATMGLGLRFLAARHTLAGDYTAAVLLVDGRIGARLPGKLQVGLEAKNLFNAHYGDPASREHLQDEIPQDGRTFFATLAFQP